MKEFSKFIFKGHNFDQTTLVASFFYSFDNEANFTETIDFSCQGFETIPNIDPEIVDNLLFHLSIALGISYYKLYPKADLVIEKGYLDQDQIIFWKKFYINGLGEFFFTNNISPTGLVNFINLNEQNENKLFNIKDSNHSAMIPIGGGKDSLVSIELIRKIGIPFDTITIGKNYPLHQSVSDQIGVPRLNFSRNIDPQLFEMNKEGYYNGHVPISGIFAFALAFTAYIYNYKHIVMSNEKSANEGNTTMDGIDINHQRSKSLEFEIDFGKYLTQYISTDINYFSLLRGMYEIKIAELFAKDGKKYFPYFSSCNTNFKQTGSNGKIRCNNCPKCAFVYSILRPYITEKETIQIFGEELYSNPNLEQTFKELLGLDGIKPFECVGTNEEVVLSMYKLINQLPIESEITNTNILKVFKQEIMSKMTESNFIDLENKLTKIYDDDLIPNYIKQQSETFNS